MTAVARLELPGIRVELRAALTAEVFSKFFDDRLVAAATLVIASHDAPPGKQVAIALPFVQLAARFLHFGKPGNWARDQKHKPQETEMANFEDRNRDSAKNDPNRKDNDEFEPGREERRGPGQEEGSEPREGQGQRSGLEYPGEGVAQHYPSSGRETGNKPSGEEAGTDNDNDEAE